MNEELIEVHEEEIRLTLEHAKKEGYDYFSFVTAVDYKDRFLCVWRLINTRGKSSLVIEAEIDRDNPVLPSSVDLWKGANWQEREVYDLFGIKFKGHGNLKRILLPGNFKGYPLKKDFESKKVEKRPENFV